MLHMIHVNKYEVAKNYTKYPMFHIFQNTKSSSMDMQKGHICQMLYVTYVTCHKYEVTRNVTLGERLYYRFLET